MENPTLLSSLTHRSRDSSCLLDYLPGALFRGRAEGTGQRERKRGTEWEIERKTDSETGNERPTDRDTQTDGLM